MRPALAARTGVWKDEAVQDPARHATPRPDIAGSPRTVVKIGSSSLTTKNGAIDDARIAALADARRGLLGGQVLRALLQAERGHARGDRTRGDQEHLVAAAGPGGDRVGQRGDTGVIDRAVLRGK